MNTNIASSRHFQGFCIARLISAFLLFLPVVANAGNVEVADSTVYEIDAVDVRPEFPGGMKGLLEYVAANMKYTESCWQPVGRIIVKFVVYADGSVGSISVVKSIDPEYYDGEIVRLVREMPSWSPAMLDGKKVNAWFALPVNLRMADDEED